MRTIAAGATAPPEIPGPAVGRNPGVQLSPGHYPAGATELPRQPRSPRTGRSLSDAAAPPMHGDAACHEDIAR